jgi:hypothetical protein
MLFFFKHASVLLETVSYRSASAALSQPQSGLPSAAATWMASPQNLSKTSRQGTVQMPLAFGSRFDGGF